MAQTRETHTPLECELLDVAKALVGSVIRRDDRGNIYALSELHEAVEMARAALAKAE